jgi:hypothetical protein
MVSYLFPSFFVVIKDEHKNLTTFEVLLVVRFLNAKNVRLMGIHRQIVAVYGEAAVKEDNVKKLCPLFKEGTTVCNWTLPPVHICNLNSSSGKFLSILHTAPTLHQVIITCFFMSRNCWPPRVWGVTKRHHVRLVESLDGDLFQRRHTKGGPTI